MNKASQQWLANRCWTRCRKCPLNFSNNLFFWSGVLRRISLSIRREHDWLFTIFSSLPSASLYTFARKRDRSSAEGKSLSSRSSSARRKYSCSSSSRRPKKGLSVALDTCAWSSGSSALSRPRNWISSAFVDFCLFAR